MVEKLCEYLLPRGYCDKYDVPCKARKEDLANFYGVPLADIKECEHEWELTESSLDPIYVTHYYVCSKCGEKKSSSLGF